MRNYGAVSVERSLRGSLLLATPLAHQTSSREFVAIQVVRESLAPAREKTVQPYVLTCFVTQLLTKYSHEPRDPSHTVREATGAATDDP